MLERFNRETYRPRHTARNALFPAFAMATATASAGPPDATVSVRGELNHWHKLTLDFLGPETSEIAEKNPFTDYRLDVSFSHAPSGKTYRAPGYYAADGDAAETGAASGRDDWRNYARHALAFFERNGVPFWEMRNDNSISDATHSYAFCKAGEVYVVYLKTGGTASLDLRGLAGRFDVRWYDPRHRGRLQAGLLQQATGGGWRPVGLPPGDAAEDWVVLFRKAP